MEAGLDRRLMQVALALARRRVGAVGARPAVGAVIASGGRILGRGATGPDGVPHGEIVALSQARERHGADALRGATAYVTLEPCAHHGRTPPCAEALVAAGIGRLVAPMEDPDPRVSGRGFARLREAGIRVETGLAEAAAREVNRGFLARTSRGRPWLTLKLAATLDGRIATAAGESRWITGPAARLRVHLMRLRADAVLIGSGTALADDPALDVRGFGADAAQPMRVVLDGRARLSPDSRVASGAAAQPAVILHLPGADRARREGLAARGVCLLECPAGADGRIDPRAALERLAADGVNAVLCEGGGTLAAALLRAGLVDEIALFTAGRVLGGDALAAVGPLGPGALADAPAFALHALERLGPDTLSFWRPRA
ncbi:MAG TPA: bifunctional diaminohydroxyphosphoribosylaminopyrimidine deaminase/5-amino-6-(5-phosphoribosylamino)uracil reductase RibD [Thermohalobaculum sp.]|nr:bifunctional diaminohydroxyphosphoribosylaminopyrimidine deaminase/5-amino-6-(5-phosphoribosylamino)uracil reductase RibD [Thermohalobaculum sp.]